MGYLLAVSLAWAFSFGMIRALLVGLDSSFVACVRMLLACAVFLPFFRPRRLDAPVALWLLGIGALQFGVMYIAYIEAYQYLQGHQVAIFTIFTPLFVALIHDVQEKRLHPAFLLAAVGAVCGAGIINYTADAWGAFLRGFALVQAANLCFAFGQLQYRRVMARASGLRDREGFAWLYLGAVLVTGLIAGVRTGGSLPGVSGDQWLALLYLGVVPSGVCFFLWNVGARRVNAGTLAAFNNVKIPLAVAVALLVFGERVDWLRLLLGGIAIAASLAANELHVRRRQREEGAQATAAAVRS